MSWPSTLLSVCLSNTTGASSPLTSAPIGVMLLMRRQPVSPAAALNNSCPIRTLNCLYTKFGIDLNLSLCIRYTSVPSNGILIGISRVGDNCHHIPLMYLCIVLREKEQPSRCWRLYGEFFFH